MGKAKRTGIAAVVALAIALLLAWLPTNNDRLDTFETERLSDAISASASKHKTKLSCEIIPETKAAQGVASKLDGKKPFGTEGKDISDCAIRVSKEFWLWRAEIQIGEEAPSLVRVPRIRWSALLPALIAVSMAIVTRRLVLSLLAGVAVGSMIWQTDGSLISMLGGVTVGTATLIGKVFVDDFRLYIFLFTFALIGMVNVATASGGMAGLANLLGRIAKGVRSTQAATALLGVAVFFDDYSNTVVVGSSMRPLSDRALISREKLAYIVDSTTAPVAGLALISTWIGYEVSLISDAMGLLKIDGSPYSFFIQTLPFRFYCILALIFLWLTIFTGREFGPMRKAQERSLRDKTPLRPGSVPLSGAKAAVAIGKPVAITAIVPVLAVIAWVLIGMALNGAGVVGPFGWNAAAWAAFDSSRLFVLDNNYLIASQDGAWVLATASIAGSVIAIALGALVGKAPLGSLILAWLASWRILILAFSILILAWSIGDLNNYLGTGPFLVAALADGIPPWILPGTIFILGAAISFSTGTSWGTMAVLLPAALPLAYHVGGEALMIISIGAVLDGSIFGDHCSPLSDTTIMSSISTGCDHIDHVQTQLPYAGLVAIIALTLGYLLASQVHPAFSYLLASIAFYSVLRLAGKRIVAPAVSPNP